MKKRKGKKEKENHRYDLAAWPKAWSCMHIHGRKTPVLRSFASTRALSSIRSTDTHKKKGWISILGTSDQRPDALCSKEKADFYRKKMLATEDDDPSRRTNNKAVSKYVIMRYIYFFFFLPHAMHTWLDSLFT